MVSTQHSALSTSQFNLIRILVITITTILFAQLVHAQTVYKGKIFGDNFESAFHVGSTPKSSCDAAIDAYPELLPRNRTNTVACYPQNGGWVYGEDTEKYEVVDCLERTDLNGVHSTLPFVWGICSIRFTFSSTCPNSESYTGSRFDHTCYVSIKPPTLIGFFNGVANTEKEGRASLDILKTELPTTPEKPTEYELFYNQSGCKEGVTGKVSCLQDVAEVFEQRSTELSGVLGNRWEVFWEILAGKHQQPGSLTSTLLSRLVDTGSALFGLIDAIFSNVITRFASAFTNILSLINSPPTVADKEAHLATLKTYADKRYGMVLVAHSQGNLFVNAAYDSIKASHPSVKAEVVHVAPASPTLRGGYGLADIDLVINALRLTGVTSVPPNNILGMPPSKDDMTGHSFASTYMDKLRAAYTDIKAKLTAAFELASQ